MIGKAGLLTRLIRAELQRGNSASLITFNVDLLAENALALLKTSRVSQPWSLVTGYGFEKPPDLIRSGREVFPSAQEPSGVLLLKMHGSVNWVFKHRDFYPPPNLVSKRRDFFIIADQRLAERRTVYVNPRGGRDWYLFPLIVPPIYEKHGFIRMHLQEVWDTASAMLRGASRVVFFGYSFPNADMHARHFFQQHAQGNPALQEPTIINPDPRAEDALWELLRPSRCLHYRDARSYLADQ